MKTNAFYHLTISFLILLSPLTLLAQTNITANLAADHVQRMRDTARKWYDKKDATSEDVKNGIAILKRAIIFLDSLPVRKLAPSSPYLNYRRPDVLRELTYAYAKDKQYEQAIATLSKHFEFGTNSYVLNLLKEPEFAELSKDERFISLIERYKRRAGLWSGEAFQTPYQADLPMTEKLAGLSLLWSQAKLGFAYFDRLTIDWNKTYMDFIPQVQATKSTKEYYYVLQKFYASLHDGHTNVNFPKELDTEVYARLPLHAELINNRVYIIDVLSDSLKRTGLIPGLEVIKVDGEPVKQYAEAHVQPYLSSSTKQDLDLRTYTYMLFAGPVTQPVQLELKDRKGKMISMTIPRSLYTGIKQKPTMEYKEIGKTGYLTIRSFQDSRIVAQFDSLFPQIASTQALIIDIRNNGGGDSGIGNSILSYLTDKPFDLFQHKNVAFNSLSSPPNQPEASWNENGIARHNANGKNFYDKPIVLLINAGTFSAAEDFAVAFDAMKRGKIVGLPSGGSSGQPLRLSLPGGGTARYCARRESYPDGKEFVGIGILPHILVPRDINDVFKGNDSTLKKALDVLK